MIDLNRIYALEMMRKRRIAQSTGYRTEDLILHLDGIQNTRAGTHNPSATVWEDLTGNMDVTLYNATWGADHVSFTGANNSYGKGARWTFAKGTTIEIVFKMQFSILETAGVCGWAGDPATEYPFSRIYITNSGALNFRSEGSALLPHSTLLSLTSFKYASGNWNFVAINGDIESRSIEGKIGTTVMSFYVAVAGSGSIVDAPAAGANFPGNIYAVRVYDANLTAEELYAHWLIDKKRFNIPE